MTLAFWRDVALVWLALLCFIGMAVPLAAALFAVKGTGLVLDRVPALLGKTQNVTRRVREGTDAAGRQVVTRVMTVQDRVNHGLNAFQRVTGRRADDIR